MNEGSVYIIECQGLYKIGVSNCIASRVSSLQTATPFKISLIDTLDSPRPYALERHLHNSFAQKRVQGEWFALDNDDLSRVRDIALTVPEQLQFSNELFDFPMDDESQARWRLLFLGDGGDFEKLWICPVCGFLAGKPGTCDGCSGRE